MLLSTYGKLRTENNTSTIALDSGGIYVNVQIAYVYRQIRGDLHIKCNQALLDCHTMLPEDVANVIIPLHATTGNDYTPEYYGHREKPLLQHLMNIWWKILRQESPQGEWARVVL